MCDTKCQIWCVHTDVVHTTADNNTLRRAFAYFSNTLMWGFCVGIPDCLCMWEKERRVGKERALWSCMWLCNPWCLLIFCLHQPSVQPAEQTDPRLSLSLFQSLPYFGEKFIPQKERDDDLLGWAAALWIRSKKCSKMKIVDGGRIYVFMWAEVG